MRGGSGVRSFIWAERELKNIVATRSYCHAAL
jgi:hypothetical protein